jgi:excisionase family DNA binding protein
VNEEPERLAVSMAEAAKMLGLHIQTIRTLCLNGELRASRVGKRWIIEVDELHRFLRRTRV